MKLKKLLCLIIAFTMVIALAPTVTSAEVLPEEDLSYLVGEVRITSFFNTQTLISRYGYDEAFFEDNFLFFLNWEFPSGGRWTLHVSSVYDTGEQINIEIIKTPPNFPPHVRVSANIIFELDRRLLDRDFSINIRYQHMLQFENIIHVPLHEYNSTLLYAIAGGQWYRQVMRRFYENGTLFIKNEFSFPTNIGSISSGHEPESIKKIVLSGPVSHSWSSVFRGLSNLISIDGLNYFDTSNTTSMNYMFEDASSLKSLDLSNWDVSNVISMTDMFRNTTSLQQLTLGENFRFISHHFGNAALPTVPENEYFTGVWQNVGIGTVGNPLGEFEFTSDELMTYYDGAIHTDTWVWQPTEENRVVEQPCDDCGEYDCDGDCGDVPPPPHTLQITPSPINFGTIQQGQSNPGAIPITITNVGETELTLNPLPNVVGFTFGNLPNPVLEPGQSRTISVNVNANLPVGTHNTTATITTVEGASATVELRFVVTAPQNNNNNNLSNNNPNWNNNRPSGNVFTRPPVTNSNNNTANNNSQMPVERTFTDVSPSDWFAPYVLQAVSSGLLNGVGNGEFAPNAAPPRAMFVTVLWRLAGSPNGYNGGNFSDVVNDNWYSQAIAWAVANGIVTGVGNGYFAPDLNITREQMGIILYRYVGDAVDAVMDRNYVPQNTATRAEMAAIVLRLNNQ